MPLGDPHSEPQGEVDHILGVGHRGQRMDQTATLLTSTGVPLAVNLTSAASKPTKKEVAVEPKPVKKEVKSEPELTAINPTVLVQMIFNTKMGKGFKLIPNLDEEIWITSHMEEGSSWSIPYNDVQLRLINPNDWKRGVQALVDMLITEDGPLNPSLSFTLEDVFDDAVGENI